MVVGSKFDNAEISSSALLTSEIFLIYHAFPSALELICGRPSEVIKYLQGLGYEFYVIERKFEFGDVIGWSVTRLFLEIIFGEQLRFVRVTQLKKQSYDVILAVAK